MSGLLASSTTLRGVHLVEGSQPVVDDLPGAPLPPVVAILGMDEVGRQCATLGAQVRVE